VGQTTHRETRGSRLAPTAAYGMLAVVYLLTRLLLVWRFPPHYDEAVFADWTARGVAAGGNQLFLPLTGGQQPLLVWLGAGLVDLGVEPLSSLRLVSVGAGLVTLAVIAALGHRLGGHRVALASGAVWIVLPFALVYTVVGMYDPLAGMFVAAALLLQVELAQRPRLDVALVLGAVFAGALLTKLTASVALYLIPLSALVFDWSRVRLGRRLASWLGYLGLALVIAWAAYQVLKLSDFYDDLGASREVLAQHSVGEALSRPWHWISANWPTYQDALLGYLTIPLVVVAIVGVVVGARTQLPLTLCVTGWFVLPATAIVLLADFPYTRWLTVAVPALVPLVALGAVAMVDTARRRLPGARPGLAAGAAVALCLAAALWFDVRVLAAPTTAPYPGDDLKAFVTQFSAGAIWPDVAGDLETLSDGRALVVAAGPFCCTSLALELGPTSTVSFVRSDSDDAATTLFAVENVIPLPPRGGDLRWKPLESYGRPRNGAASVLYQSAVTYRSQLIVSPDWLRAAIGGTDDDYDAYLSERPEVSAWAEAWYEARSDGNE
jgi:4-amino-4-deoxy-L-arabinose transferase-like glycosyltransferase